MWRQHLQIYLLKIQSKYSEKHPSMPLKYIHPVFLKSFHIKYTRLEIETRFEVRGSVFFVRFRRLNVRVRYFGNQVRRFNVRIYESGLGYYLGQVRGQKLLGSFHLFLKWLNESLLLMQMLLHLRKKQSSEFWQCHGLMC